MRQLGRKPAFQSSSRGHIAPQLLSLQRPKRGVVATLQWMLVGRRIFTGASTVGRTPAGEYRFRQKRAPRADWRPIDSMKGATTDRERSASPSRTRFFLRGRSQSGSRHRFRRSVCFWGPPAPQAPEAERWADPIACRLKTPDSLSAVALDSEERSVPLLCAAS